jgi:hypothetical protein
MFWIARTVTSLCNLMKEYVRFRITRGFSQPRRNQPNFLNSRLYGYFTPRRDAQWGEEEMQEGEHRCIMSSKSYEMIWAMYWLYSMMTPYFVLCQDIFWLAYVNCRVTKIICMWILMLCMMLCWCLNILICIYSLFCVVMLSIFII